MSSKIDDAISRGFIRVSAGCVVIISTFMFSGQLSQELIVSLRSLAILPLSVSLIDVLTVRVRTNKNSPEKLVLQQGKERFIQAIKITVNGFGRNIETNIEEGLIDECGKCNRTDHQGITVTYENPYKLFGMKVKDTSPKKAKYCTVCTKDPTFEVEEEWGREEEVVEALNEYYSSR